MTFLRNIYTLVRFELKAEIRTKETALLVLFFCASLMVLFSFALTAIGRPVVRRFAPVLIWIVVLFGSTIALARAFSREREQGVLDAYLLSPMSMRTLFTAKALVQLIFLVVVELVTIPILAALTNLPLWNRAGELTAAMVMGTRAPPPAA